MAGPTTHGSQPSRLRQAFRRLAPDRLAVIGAEPAYSTSGGGFRSANRPEPPVRGDPGSGRGGPQLGGSSGGGGGPRMPRGGGGAPAPRPERYWTDYLRIVLPIIGLLLMLSVFIFWVGNIIDGNDDGDDTAGTEVAISTTTPDPAAAAPTATVAAAADSVTPTIDPAAQSPAETASEEPAGAPSTAPEGGATEPPADDDPVVEPTDDTAPEEEATEEAVDGDTSPDAAFGVDEVVVMARNGNMRSEPSTDGGDTTVIVLLNEGTELTITGEPENDGEFDWYPVESANDGPGFVREDFLAVAG